MNNKKQMSIKSSKKNKIKTQGAVFTPKNVINDMLNSLPDYVWENTTMKWLEPSAGIGNFIIEIHRRNPNISIKCVEIDSEFCKECKYNTSLDDKNIINADFIKYDFCEQFDVIVGNPPYQKENKKNNKCRGGFSQLYLLFLDKCLSLLKPNGYLLFIHPSSWRKIGNQYLKKMLENMTFYTISLHNKKLFPGINVSVDWYLLKNAIEPNKKTNIDGISFFIDRHLPFIPNKLTLDIQETIFSIHIGKNYQCILSCELHAYTKKHLLSRNKDIKRGFVYPIYNTSAQGLIWSKVPHTHQYCNKVILSNSGKLNPFYDSKLGTTQNSMYILVDNEEVAIHIIHKLKEYSDFINLCQWGLFRTERKLIEYFGF